MFSGTGPHKEAGPRGRPLFGRTDDYSIILIQNEKNRQTALPSHLESHGCFLLTPVITACHSKDNGRSSCAGKGMGRSCARRIPQGGEMKSASNHRKTGNGRAAGKTGARNPLTSWTFLPDCDRNDPLLKEIMGDCAAGSTILELFAQYMKDLRVNPDNNAVQLRKMAKLFESGITPPPRGRSSLRRAPLLQNRRYPRAALLHIQRPGNALGRYGLRPEPLGRQELFARGCRGGGCNHPSPPRPAVERLFSASTTSTKLS